MLMFKERRPVTRTLRGWAISVLQEAGAIRECEEHGWMQDPCRPARSRAGLRHRTSGFADGLHRWKPWRRCAMFWIR
ncbi:hypothetical protein ABIF64_000581 [Bradyrhizobium japonicum]|uniref:Transposase n=1 Tax=Bradyrhizobium japonicum TaxID=375 RepID=A0ABV2RJZ9_BRAJP